MIKKRLRDWMRAQVEHELDKHANDQTEYHRASPAVQIAQRNLVATWKAQAQAGIIHALDDVGFRNFSQFEEDGILLYLMTVLGSPSRTFVDLGSADGINSNCANLAINHQWTGLFVDGNAEKIEYGRSWYATHGNTWIYPPKFVCSMITRENVNHLIKEASMERDIDLLSIDIDGHDYWVWEALECVRPRVIMIEAHIEFGLRSIVVPYDKDYVYPGKHPQYHGASPVAITKLAKKKGYRLIGANRYGFNSIYLRDDVGLEEFPEVSVESTLQHPRNQERQKLFDEISDWEYVNV
ncbi:hypothetical protein Q31b_26270 [Novipirellula aureliae]|uniref:Methyltransferase FkbM domain-containing protein n=1 Tax=Novipirellula aureliae TaxID=2527966 RepID=A0A5C6DX09_9BACT|nr:hypothetical protein [Novipirellula aureliae]TWU41188.1 hypothetical protein Q31b_26270 [Novipirellula aureliae]